MGQSLRVILDGVHRGWAQKLAQTWKVARREVERNKNGVVGPTEVASKNHQRWGCGDCVVVQGRWLPLQVCLGKCGAHRKNHKNKVTMGFQSSAGGYELVKISRPKSTHKIQNKSWNFCIFHEICNFDFWDFLYQVDFHELLIITND